MKTCNTKVKLDTSDMRGNAQYFHNELKIYYKYIIYEHILLARTLFFKVVIGHTNTLKKIKSICIRIFQFIAN